MTHLELAELDGTVSPRASIPVLISVLTRHVLSRGRIVGLCLLSILGIVVVLLGQRSADPQGALLATLVEYGVSIAIPLGSLVVAAPILSEIIEDRLLVYLVVKPIPSWHHGVAGLLASVIVVTPAVVVPIALSAAMVRETSLAAATLLAGVIGAVAYSALHLFLGTRFRGGLWIGLAYLLIWENLIARAGEAAARFSIRSYLVTIVSWATERQVPLAGRADWAALAVPTAVAVVAVLLTARFLSHHDID